MNDLQLDRGRKRLARRQQGPVTRRELRALYLAPQHRELMSEHDAFQILGLLRARAQERELQ